MSGCVHCKCHGIPTPEGGCPKCGLGIPITVPEHSGLPQEDVEFTILDELCLQQPPTGAHSKMELHELVSRLYLGDTDYDDGVRVTLLGRAIEGHSASELLMATRLLIASNNETKGVVVNSIFGKVLDDWKPSPPDDPPSGSVRR